MIRGFQHFDAVAAPLPLRNVDTDMILAGRYFKTISREGLGTKLFADLRTEADGRERPDFVLNREPWKEAGILVVLDNFGTGSSREHAPWALLDFGICCLIAPSFADIFYNNCFKNFILPIVLDGDAIARLMSRAEDAQRCRMRIDLSAQTITLDDGDMIAFEIEPERKHAMLNGVDEIAVSLRKSADIAQWEAQTQRLAPAIPVDVAELQDR